MNYEKKKYMVYACEYLVQISYRQEYSKPTFILYFTIYRR